MNIYSTARLEVGEVRLERTDPTCLNCLRTKHVPRIVRKLFLLSSPNSFNFLLYMQHQYKSVWVVGAGEKALMKM